MAKVTRTTILIPVALILMTIVNFKEKNRANVKVKRLSTNRKILSLEKFMRNMESLISKYLIVITSSLVTCISFNVASKKSQ